MLAAAVLFGIGMWGVPCAADDGLSQQAQATMRIGLVIPARANLRTAGSGQQAASAEDRVRLDLCAPAQTLVLETGGVPRTLRTVRKGGCRTGVLEMPAVSRPGSPSVERTATLFVRPE